MSRDAAGASANSAVKSIPFTRTCKHTHARTLHATRHSWWPLSARMAWPVCTAAFCSSDTVLHPHTNTQFTHNQALLVAPRGARVVRPHRALSGWSPGLPGAARRHERARGRRLLCEQNRGHWPGFFPDSMHLGTLAAAAKRQTACQMHQITQWRQRAAGRH